ncbi:hypothetical protein GLYMA_14G113866v4 [Glycine max]|nr:hypothetical protein GLYMA_14G113866v4 [Glycine max]KAH1094121.1 hypothetical protein GYH30_039721 [Glycine max]
MLPKAMLFFIQAFIIHRLGLYFDLQYFEDMVLEGSWDE